MSRHLAGRIALVTGASSGIGEATALALAEAGASVAISARREDRLASLAAQIEAAGSRALVLPGDLTVEAEAVRTVEETVARMGRIDILVNSAGIMDFGGIENCSTDRYRRVFDINLFSPLYTAVAAVKHMRAQGEGDIITISSLAARKSGPATNAYSASKHAVNSMTDAMRQELGSHNIRVSTLMPGATSTEIGDSLSDPNLRQMMQAHVGKKGAVLPAQIAETVLFILRLPRNVNISEICVRPTIDTTA